MLPISDGKQRAKLAKGEGENERKEKTRRTKEKELSSLDEGNGRNRTRRGGKGGWHRGCSEKGCEERERS